MVGLHFTELLDVCVILSSPSERVKASSLPLVLSTSQYNEKKKILIQEVMKEQEVVTL